MDAWMFHMENNRTGYELTMMFDYKGNAIAFAEHMASENGLERIYPYFPARDFIEWWASYGNDSMFRISVSCVNVTPGFISKHRESITRMWRELGDVCIDDAERTESGFYCWPAGTDRLDIWRWFDDRYAPWGGVYALMFPGASQEEER